jgi:biopolymer transport protein ExbD
MSEINVTPFVDVMLVLLIIFMVTAPLLTVGVQVDLPETAADTLPDEQEPLTLSINSKGEVFIQEHQVVFDKLIPKILAISIIELTQEYMSGETKQSITEGYWKLWVCCLGLVFQRLH